MRQYGEEEEEIEEQVYQHYEEPMKDIQKVGHPTGHVV